MAPYGSKSTFDGADFDPNSGARLFVFSKKNDFHEKIGHEKIGHDKIGHEKIDFHEKIGHDKIGHDKIDFP